MTCESFERWLDAGMPARAAAEARAHAALCAQCAASESAAADLEVLLASELPEAPPGFTSVVMERVAATQSEAARWRAFANPLPLWLRAAAQPACALALVLSALFLWCMAHLPQVSLRIMNALAAAQSALTTHLPLPVEPVSHVGAALLLLPVTWLASRALYRASQAWVRRTVLGRP